MSVWDVSETRTKDRTKEQALLASCDFRLTCNGKDLRTERLLDRKQELRRLLARACAPLKYTEYIEGCGTELFQRVCELDLEGIVAKAEVWAYVTEREHSTWFKILNREYSQKDGREELFERERHSEPVAGWHSCALACAELEPAIRAS